MTKTMKFTYVRSALLLSLAVSAAGLLFGLVSVRAQIPLWPEPPPLMPVPSTPEAQRQAMNNVRGRVNWLKNATRTAPGYGTGGDGIVWRSFEALRVEYTTFTRSLNAQQIAYCANELAELAAGLDILQEAFPNYQEDIRSGRPPGQALRDMCEVLRKGADVWVEEFNRDCARLRIGR
jgi:hypothetical protein